MKYIGTIALLISLTITSYLLWDTQQQLSLSQGNARDFMEQALCTEALALALLRYQNGKINRGSLLVVLDDYQDFADSVIARRGLK